MEKELKEIKQRIQLFVDTYCINGMNVYIDTEEIKRIDETVVHRKVSISVEV